MTVGRSYAGVGIQPLEHDEVEFPEPGRRTLTGEIDLREHGPPETDSFDSRSELPTPFRSKMESALGMGLGDINFYAGPRAALRSEQLGAHAFTEGRNIHFGAGQFDPESRSGQELIAHELHHARAQRTEGVSIQRRAVGGSDGSAAEGQADAFAAQAVGGQSENPAAEAGRYAEVGQALEGLNQTLTTIDETLLPSYRRAVDALDPAGATQLAQAIVQGLLQVKQTQDRLTDGAVAASPEAGLVSQPESANASGAGAPAAEPTADQQQEQAQVTASITEARTRVSQLKQKLSVQMGPQFFHDRPISGSLTSLGPEISETAIAREAGVVVDILLETAGIRAALGDPARAAEWAEDKRNEAITRIVGWRSRPVNFYFLRRVLTEAGYWQPLASGDSENRLGETIAAVQDQTRETGVLADVGGFDAAQANDLLSGVVISDEDATQVAGMVMSASGAARGQLLAQLHRSGRLETMCENLPFRQVQTLMESATDPEIRAAMQATIEGKGGGRSLSREYDDAILDNLTDADNGSGLSSAIDSTQAYLWTFLRTAHNATSFGFLDAHDGAYDAAQAGLISDDAYWSNTTKAVGRSAALAGVTALTGGAAGAWGEGMALGMNAGRTTAQIIGGGIGGAASGVAGQFTADVYDQALMGREGFSEAGDYAMAGLTGAAGGALVAGVGAAGAQYLPNSAKTMAQVYAERYPRLDNFLTRFRGSGTRTGLRIKVTQQEIGALLESSLVTRADLDAALQRIGAVWRNDRVDISGTLTRVHPQSEIEKMFGDVDPATGAVNVRNTDPSAGGYSAATDQLPPGWDATDASVTEALGINGRGPVDPASGRGWYDKYSNPADPLFEVVFRTDVELDVPLPADNRGATGYGTLGGKDPVTNHMPGTGVTPSGAGEGILPRGARIEIVSIEPIGTPRTSYPPAGGSFSPWPAAAPAVRGLNAPAAGAAAGVAMGEAIQSQQPDAPESESPNESPNESIDPYADQMSIP